MKNIFEQIKNLSYVDGFKVLEKHYQIKLEACENDGLYDNYVVRIDDDNWICYTSKIIDKPVDDEIILGEGSWNCCIEGEMFY
jgi:hypothetical protein